MLCTFARRVGVVSVVWAVSCGGTAPLTDAGADDALARLERDTGHPWQVRWHRDLHTPAFLEGRTPPLAAAPLDAERAAKAFLTQYRGLYRMHKPADELHAIESVTDELGITHTRFQQRLGGVPVEGGDLIVHFAPDGALVCVNGRYEPLPALAEAPARTAEEARLAAIADARAARPELPPIAFTTALPKLAVLPAAPPEAGVTAGRAEARLAWRVAVRVADGARPAHYETFVDAADGRILDRADTLAYLDGTGVGVFGDLKRFPISERLASYWLEDASRGAPPQKIFSARYGAKLPGGEIKSKSTDVWDETGEGHGSAVDAQVYVAAAWDYFAKVHGRQGFDGHGHGVHASVHFGRGYVGAFFDGTRLVFGDGDGQTIAPASGGLDVVAHEFTHGVVRHSANLPTRGESGALNEALADLFASFLVHRDRPGQEWRYGESIRIPRANARPLRDLAHPHASGHPETMAEYDEAPDDNGSVHVNATIPGHAGYLMVTEPGGLGWDAAERVWYRALRRYFTSRARFADAADATRLAARELGFAPAPVRRAWVAVGVASE